MAGAIHFRCIPNRKESIEPPIFECLFFCSTNAIALPCSDTDNSLFTKDTESLRSLAPSDIQLSSATTSLIQAVGSYTSLGVDGGDFSAGNEGQVMTMTRRPVPVWMRPDPASRDRENQPRPGRFWRDHLAELRERDFDNYMQVLG